MKKNEHGLYEAHIDGKNYEFEKWGAEDSLDVLIDLSQMVGKPIGMAFAALMGKEGLNKEMDANVMGSVFDSLFQNCNKEKAKPIIKKLSTDKVMCGGKAIVFDVHYDRLMHLFKVVKANLEVQYGSFFDELLELTKLRGALK